LYRFERPEKGGRTLKGAFDAETESDWSYVGVSGNWGGGGNTDYLRDGDSNIPPGDGECCYREKDWPAVRKVPFGTSRAE
jgi:hypothetical protein